MRPNPGRSSRPTQKEQQQSTGVCYVLPLRSKGTSTNHSNLLHWNLLIRRLVIMASAFPPFYSTRQKEQQELVPIPVRLVDLSEGTNTQLDSGPSSHSSPTDQKQVVRIPVSQVGMFGRTGRKTSGLLSANVLRSEITTLVQPHPGVSSRPCGWVRSQANPVLLRCLVSHSRISNT